MFGIENSANNFGASAGLLSGLDSQKPVRAALGTIYFATDTIFIYRFTGSFWVLYSGGGQPFGGVENGLTYVSGFYVGLGGNLTQNTQINCASSYLIKFDNFTQFGIGNNIEPSMLFDTNNGQITTSYNGAINGISLDFLNNELKFGNFGSGSYLIKDVNGYLVTYSNGNGVGFLIAGNAYCSVGDWGSSIAALRTLYNFSSNRIENYSGDGYYNFANVPSYADNNDALSNGLVVGDIYKWVTGPIPFGAPIQLAIVY